MFLGCLRNHSTCQHTHEDIAKQKLLKALLHAFNGDNQPTCNEIQAMNREKQHLPVAEVTTSHRMFTALRLHFLS